MPLNPLYVTSVALDPPIIDKVSGQPLNGYAWFYQDLNRIVPKLVYELTGSPPNYNYIALPNPVQIVNGKFVDANNNDCALYYYPYDDAGDLQLYYVAVFNSQNVPQFTRQAWPNLTLQTEPGAGVSGSLDNTIVNGQFAFVNFNTTSNPTSQLVLTTSSGNQSFNIAPGWMLLTTSTSAGTVTINQIAISGANNYPGQPPYALQVTTSGGLTSVILQQALTGNPNIFSQDSNGNGGFVNTSITLAPGLDNVITINYIAGPESITLLTANNTSSGLWTTFNQNATLPVGGNPASGPTSATDIQLVLPVSGTIEFSNLQLIYSQVPFANSNGIAYEQVPVAVQQGQLFGYYQPQLNYKPLDSYLVGWDFPKNPGQLGYIFTAAGAPAGVNLSAYTWDQTILFQSASQTAGVTQGSSGEYVITATGATQVALIQYLDQAEAREILAGNVSVNIAGYTTNTGGIVGTVSLWVTAGNVGTQMTTNNSIVASLNAAGYPTTTPPNAGTWTEITPGLGGAGTATFSLGAAKTGTASQYNNIALNSFGLNNAGAITSATVNQFAIVVGFASLAATKEIVIESISLVPGDIATRTAVKSFAQTLFDSQQYYEQSFSNFAASSTATLVNAITMGLGSNIPNNVSTMLYTCLPIPYPLQIDFKTPKRSATPTITTYSTINAATSGKITIYYSGGSAGSLDVATSLWTLTKGANYCNFTTTANTFASPNIVAGNTTTPVLYYAAFQFIADARLGIIA